VSGGDEVSGGYFPSMGMGIESLGRLVFLGIWGEVDMTGFWRGAGFASSQEKIWSFGDGDW
jgi:hypothetical protein